MTSALIPLAASSLLALSSGAPSGKAAPHANQPAAVAPEARGKGAAARPSAPAAATARARANAQGRDAAHARTAPDRASGSHARTPPDRSTSSAHSSPSRGASASAHSSPSHGASASRAPSAHASAHGRTPPPRSTAHHHSSHAAPAHSAHAHGSHRPAPPPRYTPYSPAPHRAYVVRHYHVQPWQPRYWTAGVFVYEAPPARANAPARARATAAPARDLDRSHSLALGLRTGSYMSGYSGDASFGDFGLGLAARYRGNEALGLEVAYGYYNDSFTADAERVTQPVSASVELFAFPWTKASPYALGGLSWTARSYKDTLPNGTTDEIKDVQFGPHAGLGLELAVGENSSLNLEGRYTHFVSREEGDDSAPGSLQGTVGLNLYF